MAQQPSSRVMPSEREFAFVVTLFGDERANRVNPTHRERLGERVRQAMSALPAARRDVLVRWYGLDGEGALKAAGSVADRLDMSEDDVVKRHDAGVQSVKDAILASFPELEECNPACLM